MMSGLLKRTGSLKATSVWVPARRMNAVDATGMGKPKGEVSPVVLNVAFQSPVDP